MTPTCYNLRGSGPIFSATRTSAPGRRFLIRVTQSGRPGRISIMRSLQSTVIEAQDLVECVPGRQRSTPDCPVRRRFRKLPTRKNADHTFRAWLVRGLNPQKRQRPRWRSRSGQSSVSDSRTLVFQLTASCREHGNCRTLRRMRIRCDCTQDLIKS